MDDVHYMCFCRSIFPNLKAFHSHKSCCEHFKNKSDVSTKLENTSLRTVSGIRIMENNVGSKPDFIIKIMKSSTVVLDEDQDAHRNEKVATNLLGRRLPSRTKVPYLSRAVPLSTDHSYERCPCGAVFVTRIGKRQHQARFCKFLKSKSKSWQNNDTVTEICPVSQLTAVSDFIKQEDCLITEQLNNLKPNPGNAIIQVQESIQHIQD